MTRNNWRTLFATGIIGVGVVHAQGGGDLCDRIRGLTNDPAVAMAHWGVSVTTLDGTVLCGINEGQLFRPASNDKLFTMAAALALLGPDRRFRTSVMTEGELKDGVLKGNLKLVGGGDPDFGSTDVPYVEPAQRPKTPVPEPATIADIEELADKVVASGLRRVEGNIVGDDSYFAWEPYPVGWGIDDLTPGYGAPVTGLTIDDNELEVNISPNDVKAGEPALVEVLPDVGYYNMANDAVTSPREKEPRAKLEIERGVGSLVVTISGSIPLNAGERHEHLAIQDPAAYAATALLVALERRGVKVTGTSLAYHAMVEPENADSTSVAEKESAIRHSAYERVCSGSQVATGPAHAVLAMHQSPRLADDVVYTMKESQNLHAEILARDLGRMWSPPCPGLASDLGTVRASVGLGMVRAYLAVAGIAAKDFVLYDGSGLSGHDLVAPRAFTQILVYAAKQKWFDTYKAALPVGGVDGTLEHRFLPPQSTLKGRVFAKTGTLGESRALSGYVTTAGGKTLVFSVMVDNHPPGETDERVTMDKIVEAIGAQP